MTHKPFEYGVGVTDKMKRRGLRHTDVRRAFAKGAPVPVETFHGETRYAKRYLVNDRPVLLVYLENDHRVLIVSFHYRDVSR